MKKLLLSLMLISPLTFADGYIASYSIQVSDVQKFAGSFDKLMKSSWGTSFPGVVTLGHYAFNGYDDASHAVIISYDSEEDMAKGTESFYTPEFGAFLASVADVTEPVEQALNRKLASGGNGDANMNNVYTIYRMQVKDPGDYAKAWSELIDAQVAAGNIEGDYGLRAHIAGSANFYTHYAFTGSSSIQTAIEGNRDLLSSKSFEKFSKKIADNRRIMQSSMVVVLARYNYQ